MTPAWILDLLGAVMLVVAAVSAARLVLARPWRPGSAVFDTDVAHLLMGIAMAGMSTSSLTTLPGAAWEVIFGLMTAWFAVRVVLDAQANGVRALAGGHCAPHLVHSASMLYMFLAIAAPAAGGSGMPGGGPGPVMTLSHPTVALAFALVLIGYAIWDLDQLSGRRYHSASVSVSVALAGTGAPALPVLATAGSAAAAQSAGTVADVGQSSAGTVDGQAVTSGGGNDAGGQGADRGDTGGVGKFLLSPAVTVGCRIGMGVAMAFILMIAI